MDREPRFKTKILKKNKLSTQTWEIQIEKPRGFKFKPGQYIWLILEGGERRAFSISSGVNDEFLTIIFHEKESTYTKSLLNLPVDSAVWLIGPFGSSFVIDQVINQNVIMIAGGVGIAPFLSILRSLQTYKILPHIKLFLKFNHTDDVFYREEIIQICKTYNIPFKEYLQHFKEEILAGETDYINDIFFVCGPLGIINVVSEVLLNKKVPSIHIHYEQNYPTILHPLHEEDFKPLLESANVLLQAIDNLSHHIIITNTNGQIIYANKTAQKYTGYSFEQMRGNTPRLWGGLMSPEFYQKFWAQKETKEGFSGQILNRRKNGELYSVIAHITKITDKKDNVIGFLGTEEDITSRVHLEQQLAQAKATDEAILSDIGYGVLVIDKDGTVLIMNTAAMQMLCVKENEVGKKLTGLIRLEDREGNEIIEEDRPISKVLLTKKPIKIDMTSNYYYVCTKEHKFPVAMTVTPLFLKDNMIGVIEVFHDVTKEKEVDRMKTEFIALASHELRSPLSAMKWFLEMMLNGDTGVLTSEQKEFLANINESNEQMITLVNSLLDVNRIESGRIIVNPKPTNIKELIEKIIAQVKIKSDEKKQKLIVNIENSLPIINLDTQLMQEVYLNLLTNAIKYSPMGKDISLTLSVKDDFLVSSVKDNGYGILEKEKDKVFQKFFKGENITEETGRIGLGLYLTKSIVESSNGKIWFESEVNKGTTFYFTIPISGMKKKEGSIRLTKYSSQININ